MCMQLTAIGESLKNLDKVTDNSLLPQYPQVDWKRAKGLRDIISHHYFDLNEEAIYNVCKDNIPELAKTIKKIIEEI
ncbi:MAG: HepT-like ribonuclease domain-containing protein [Spirochaetota bacterium]|nr:HepT-like ribonuclease domain-containing protein [Spirochaetota bacterium]